MRSQFFCTATATFFRFFLLSLLLSGCLFDNDFIGFGRGVLRLPQLGESYSGALHVLRCGVDDGTMLRVWLLYGIHNSLEPASL